MDFSYLQKYYGFFIDGTVITLLLSFFGVAFGVLLGVVFALMKLSKNPLLKNFAASYIEVIRGTPLLVQLYIVYYGLPRLIGMDFEDLTLGIIAISFNSAAYVAEIIRAGILS
ncbi:MAG: ABC transporter permease subunit, partial [Clostridiaceae bacterium]|nr:ABC transporter permease subunit [Clostridiaceae bacterium]